MVIFRHYIHRGEESYIIYKLEVYPEPKDNVSDAIYVDEVDKADVALDICSALNSTELYKVRDIPSYSFVDSSEYRDAYSKAEKMSPLEKITHLAFGDVLRLSDCVLVYATDGFADDDDSICCSVQHYDLNILALYTSGGEVKRVSFPSDIDKYSDEAIDVVNNIIDGLGVRLTKDRNLVTDRDLPIKYEAGTYLDCETGYVYRENGVFVCSTGSL